MASQRTLRRQPRVSYFEPEEPSLDEYVFCEKCGDYVYEYCALHGALLVIPDDKVPPKPLFHPSIPRAALTIPHVFLHLNYSTIPGAGLGVFTTLTLPCGVRFGPYRGERTRDVTSDYSWQIYDRNHKPCHVVDASNANKSNWMRYVNCARHFREQNLVAFQYKGELYYRTIRIVPKFSELMVFYGSEYAHLLHIDLGKYNSPKNYAQKFGAPAPKKPKFGVENKKSRDKFVKPNKLPLEPNKESHVPASTQQTNEPATFQKGIKEPKPQICKGAPAPKKPKFGVENKKSRDKFVKPNKLPLEPNKESHVSASTQQTNEPAAYLRATKEQKPQACKGAPANKRRKIAVDTTQSELEDNNSKPINTETSQQSVFQNGVKSSLKVQNKSKNAKTSKQTKPKFGRATKSTRISNANYTKLAITSTSVKENSTNTNAVTKAVDDNVTSNENPSENKIIQDEKSKACQIRTKVRDGKYIDIQEAYLFCDMCKFQGITKESLQKHMSLHDMKRKFACNICTYRFCSRLMLNYHKLRQHGIQLPDMEIHKCNICDYKSSLAGPLKIHLRTHTGEKPYSCDICDYKSSRADVIKIHLRTHTGEKPYTCDICDYKSSQASPLKIHLRTHTAEKPYTCDICDYKSSRAGDLKTHLRTHTGEKPYSCDICDYKSSQASPLKIHLRTHTGEKPYSCDICDYKSSQAGPLKIHLRTHTGEKPYSCDICDYKSSQASDLKKHLRTHTGEKPYSCDICDYKCTAKSSLQRHLKDKHLS